MFEGYHRRKPVEEQRVKVSYNWLKDYIDIHIDPKKFADVLTMTGANVASWEKIGNDYIFDFEITANRADCLSLIGIAREGAASLGKKLKMPQELSANRKAKPGHSKEKPFGISLEAADLCSRYTARVIRNVEVVPSPEWLKSRIISAGLRPVNNIVDITNFVLLETGQPLHAFDLDRLNGGIRIRRAEKGEKIITIDNVPRECADSTLVVADDDKAIAIAGVMGGASTEVTDMTKNILLESASFNPISIRRTSRHMGLSSESSYRFERRIDESMVLRASERAAGLIRQIAGGELGPVSDAGKKKGYKKVIPFDLQKTNSLLGMAIDKKKAFKILKALGFLVEEKKGKASVSVPSFRGDVKSLVDLSEEIARIHGYDSIPSTIPKIVGNTSIKEFIDIFEEKISRILTRLGLNEIITYSLTSRSTIRELGIGEGRVIPIKNPLSIDQEIMRPSMLGGMLGAISHNLKRKAKGIMFFEIGKIYNEKNASFLEESVLSLGLAGLKHEDWKNHRGNFDFYDLKGILERLLIGLGLAKDIVFKKETIPALEDRGSTIVEYDGEIIAYLGEVTGEVCKKFDIEKNVFFAEILLNKLEKKVNLRKRYAPYSRYPSILRDMSIVVDKEVTFYEITRIVKELGKGLVKETSLVDLYKGKQIPENKRALLYRIEYASRDKTLQDSEIDKLHTEVRNALSEKLNASFR